MPRARTGLHLLPRVNPDWFYLFGAGLPRANLPKTVPERSINTYIDSNPSNVHQ